MQQSLNEFSKMRPAYNGLHAADGLLKCTFLENFFLYSDHNSLKLIFDGPVVNKSK